MISTTMKSPVGRLTLHSNGAALTGVEFEDPKYPLPAAPAGDDAVLMTARAQLERYFEGDLTEFDLPLAPQGTPFQRRVWEALLKIPYGETWSYGGLAAEIEQPKASRAVGLANGKNPISIIIPCHRVIGADGGLTGYGGGMARKRWLLDLERPEECGLLRSCSQ